MGWPEAVSLAAILACACWTWAAMLGGRAATPFPHARMLGRVVWVRKHPASEWERCVVVAVSWRGALRVRRLSEYRPDGSHGNGFWVDKRHVAERVRDAGRWLA